MRVIVCDRVRHTVVTAPSCAELAMPETAQFSLFSRSPRSARRPGEYAAQKRELTVQRWERGRRERRDDRQSDSCVRTDAVAHRDRVADLRQNSAMRECVRSGWQGPAGREIRDPTPHRENRVTSLPRPRLQDERESIRRCLSEFSRSRHPATRCRRETLPTPPCGRIPQEAPQAPGRSRAGFRRWESSRCALFGQLSPLKSRGFQISCGCRSGQFPGSAPLALDPGVFSLSGSGFRPVVAF